jgi:hypothetical protein
MYCANALPAAVARSALPLALALVQALGPALRHLRCADPALARPLRKAAIALSHALVQCSLPAGTAQAARHLRTAHAQAREVHRLLGIAEARRHFVLEPRPELIALAHQLVDRLAAAG